jgi:hypothetical protein
MNFGANDRQAQHAERDVNTHVQDGRVGGEPRKAASHPAANWAWATAHRHYDWMDSHTPFASLD